MADIFEQILESEFSLMFFISLAVWILIFVYIFYTNTKLKKLEKELESLKEED